MVDDEVWQIVFDEVDILDDVDVVDNEIIDDVLADVADDEVDEREAEVDVEAELLVLETDEIEYKVT